jgi:lipoprotein-releasing system permease protein
MTLPIEIFIAFRYLKARKNGVFSLITTLIAIGGTTLGVAALIITLAVMSGFQTDIKNKILGVQPHIVITRVDGFPFNNSSEIATKVKENKSVEQTSGFIYRQGIIRNLETSAATGIVVKAVDFETEDKMVDLSGAVVEQMVDFNGKLGAREIVLGDELAKHIGVYAGSDVALMFPTDLTSMPRMYKFRVIAIVHSGMYDFDSSLGFIDIKEAQKLFAMPNEVGGLGVRTVNIDKVETVAKQISSTLPNAYHTRAWIEMNQNLFSALKLEKVMMFLILGLIILVAAFNIISNILLLSVQKSKEIGILSAMGFSKFVTAKIFFYEGVIVGFLGTSLGLIFGLCVSLILKYFEIFKLPKGVYYVDKLPIAILPQDVLFVVICAFVITVLAGIYPAYQVSKLDPLQAIRGE